MSAAGMIYRRATAIIALSAATSMAITASTFAACPCNAAALDSKDTPVATPRFGSDNYLTGDWLGLRNTLYDYGIEITAGYTTEPAGNLNAVIVERIS